MSYDPELSVALEAARLAGLCILRHYADFVAIPNAPASISTQADRDSQEIILQHVLRHFPDDALCAEENTPTLQNAKHSASRIWIVDPIDGTRGFAQKNGEFSVMIALAVEGKAVLGVVLEPALNRLTYASVGKGCFRLDDEKPVACRVTTTPTLEAATLVQSHSKAGVASRTAKALAPGKIVETHSAGVKLARVARGEADLYANHYLNFSDWDICAGDVLVAEAGGQVTGLRGQTIVYGKPGARQNLGLLATNKVLHEASLARLANVED